MATHIEATEIERRTAAEKLNNVLQHPPNFILIWILCFPNSIRKYFYMMLLYYIILANYVN